MDFEFHISMDDIVKQAREDITSGGYEELRTPDEVDAAMKRKGTTLVFVNSMCGCAGGIARPAAKQAIHYDKRPDFLVTVFAGLDKKATEKARTYFKDYPPSSPSFALMKDGIICKMIERHEIEASSPIAVMEKLQTLFDEYCEEI